MSDTGGATTDKNGDQVLTTQPDTPEKDARGAKEDTEYSTNTTVGTFMMKHALKNAKNASRQKDDSPAEVISRLNKEIDMLNKQVFHWSFV